jgi:DNA-binding XRE family transcriptional regulator
MNYSFCFRGYIRDPTTIHKWEKGKPVPFLVLANTLAKIETESSKFELIYF